MLCAKKLQEKNIDQLSIDHFVVAYSVTWPLNESEAGGDLVLDRNLPSFFMLMMLFSC